MWLPDAHLCYFILSAARLCVAVLLHGAATSSAISPQMHQQNPADAPPESRGTIRIRRTPTESCLHLQRVNADSYRIIFWYIVVNFVFMSIKFASVKKYTFPPNPKSLFFL